MQISYLHSQRQLNWFTCYLKQLQESAYICITVKIKLVSWKKR